MSESPPRVFTIPSSAAFLSTLAEALADGRLVPGFQPKDDPLSLASATIFLPTRRATRAFGEALLSALGTEAAILPRVLPLGDVDEDEIAFDDAAEDAPPAISPLGRRVILAQLVRQWAEALSTDRATPFAATPAVSLIFADELARVLDDLTIAGVPFEELDKAVPDQLDPYWERSRDFLGIVHRAWPEILKERELTDPTVRREWLLARETERLRAGPDGPVIAAGSTGSLPSVAKLLSVIARRKDGAVVLPGLDQMLDDEAFSLIDGNSEADSAQGHPQYGLHRLLQVLRVKRSEVVPLAQPLFPAREKLLSEAFRPTESTDRWRGQTTSGAALDGVTFVEAADPREEALAIAVSLREGLARKLPRMALVTPDRALARRVAAELTRWSIAADDSAGTPLSESEAGRLARLVAEVVAAQFAPVPLIALLRHPLLAGLADARAVDALEQGVLRGPRPAPGLTGLAHAVAHASEKAQAGGFHPNDPKSKLAPEDWNTSWALCERLRVALAPLCDLGETPHPLPRILQAHAAALRAAGLDLDDSERPDIAKLAELFDELAAAPAEKFRLTLSDYADAFAALISGATLRLPLDPQAAIRILGPIEARLLSFDRVVLGGLNEGTWPASAHTDAFLNRPMRRELHLNLPERRIGLSAHDFVQMSGAAEVVITRARRQAGAETVASRSWQRIAAVAGEKAWKQALSRGEELLSLARALDRQREKIAAIEKPAPRPPLAARPQRLSVTEIEDLVRDPYSIYAKHVLGLLPLEAVDADPGAAERGSLLHDALARFAAKYPQKLPPNPLQALLAAGKEAFAPYRDFPGAESVWWPRFARVAAWFAGMERKRRGAIERIWAETRGELSFRIGNSPFTLAAKADRIEYRRDKSAAVLDYKTGEHPTLAQAITGLAPQLPLEAAILRAGGFKDAPQAARIGEIGVFQLSGGNPPGRFFSLDPSLAKGAAKKLPERHKIRSCEELADFALTRLKALLAHYADANNPYLSRPRPKWKKRFAPYDHLARVKEWSESDGGEE